MSNSTIKQKVGKCLDCPSSSPEKPLIAKRCQTHYRSHRAKISQEKKAKREETAAWKEKKRKEMNTFLNKPQKPISKVSKKRAVENAKYTVQKIVYMAKPENKTCQVTQQPTTDIHHKMGRVGFADDWARINNIPILLDERFWLAVSREGHRQIEENVLWAKENGYSLNRL